MIHRQVAAPRHLAIGCWQFGRGTRCDQPRVSHALSPLPGLHASCALSPRLKPWALICRRCRGWTTPKSPRAQKQCERPIGHQGSASRCGHEIRQAIELKELANCEVKPGQNVVPADAVVATQLAPRLAVKLDERLRSRIKQPRQTHAGL